MQTERSEAPGLKIKRPAPRPTEVRSVSSVERGGGPSPGVYVPPFFWRNVVEGPPPRREKRGKGSYVVYHALEVDIESRLTFTTVVTVDPGESLEDHADDRIRVDSRIAVQQRLFLELIAKERAFTDRVTSRWRENLVRHLVKQRQFARRLPYRWMRKSALAVTRAEGHVGHSTIRGFRRASYGFVQFPDDLYSKAMRVWSHLYNRMGRRNLWQGMKDPRSLSNEEKSVVLFLSTAILFGTIFLLNNLFIIAPRIVPGLSNDVVGTFLAGYSEVVATFLWGVATAVALPFPPSELIALKAYYAAGPLFAFLAIVASKIAGAWLVFFIGDALHKAIDEKTKGRPRMRGMVDWMNVNASKYGTGILALFTALPFLPDTLALYVFAVSGMTFRQFMTGVAIGTIIRYAAVIGIVAFLGEGALTAIPGFG